MTSKALCASAQTCAIVTQAMTEPSVLLTADDVL